MLMKTGIYAIVIALITLLTGVGVWLFFGFAIAVTFASIAAATACGLAALSEWMNSNIHTVLQVKIAELRQDIANLETDIKSVTQQKIGLEAQMKVISTVNKNQNENCKELHREHLKTQQLISGCNDKIISLQKEKKALEEKVVEIEDKYHELEDEIKEVAPRFR